MLALSEKNEGAKVALERLANAAEEKNRILAAAMKEQVWEKVQQKVIHLCVYVIFVVIGTYGTLQRHRFGR